MVNPNYADELAATVAELIEHLETTCSCAREALSDEWDRSDEGFQAMLFVLEPVIAKAQAILEASRKQTTV